MRRDTQPLFSKIAFRISIHAPLAGCDGVQVNTQTVEPKFQSTHPLRGATQFVYLRLVDGNFNPRTPCGVRPSTTLTKSRSKPFQSTHPLRGATHQRSDHRQRPEGISIHAPLAGCDTNVAIQAAMTNLFQSTHPLRGATRFCARMDGVEEISIHAPLAGCDKLPLTCTRIFRTFQSTHPLRGATARLITHTMDAPDFNPRTPCGVRPLDGR